MSDSDIIQGTGSDGTNGKAAIVLICMVFLAFQFAMMVMGHLAIQELTDRYAGECFGPVCLESKEPCAPEIGAGPP